MRTLFFSLTLALAGLAACTSSPTADPAPKATAAATTTAPRPTPSSDGPASSAKVNEKIAEDAAAPLTPRGPEGKILCFGDSITQADWPGKIASEERWVTQLGKKSSQIQAVNAGKNGRTTEAIDELDKALTEHADAAIVLFFLGVNDMKHASVGVVDKATSDMNKMIDLARKKIPKAEVVLCAPIDVNVDKLTPYFKGEGLGPDTARFMHGLSLAYGTLAKKKGARFIDLLHAVTPDNIEDGVHANGKGQIQIADAVWKGLSER